MAGKLSRAGARREIKEWAAAAGGTAAFFAGVCLSSAGTARAAGIVLGLVALWGAAFHCGRLRERVRGPVLALALVVLMDGLSCFWAVSGKFALYEYLKVFTAFSLTAAVLAFTGEKEPGRRVCGMLEGCAALAGLVSIDLISTRWISGAVLGILGWFTPDYRELEAVEEGVRITSMFMSPNVFAGCMGIGVLLGLGLAVTAEDRRARAWHTGCVAVTSLSFVLAFSMGACAMIVPAFLALVALTGKERRPGLVMLMGETLAVTAACAFPISVTSMTAWEGARPIPLVCAGAGAAGLAALDGLAGRRIAEKLKKHGKAALWALAVTGLAAAGLVMAACTLTTGVTLEPGESVRRSAYPAAGEYRLAWEGEGEARVVIESQNREDTMMHTSRELYRGDVDGAAFTVPEDSEVVWFRFTAAQDGARLERAEYAGSGGRGEIPLGYRLLPGFIANRLQGLRANQNAIQRLVFFEDGLKLFRRSPVIGLGLGAFENGVRSVQSFRYDTKYAHNHYIQTLAETGLVGLALFLGLLGISAAWIWRGRREPLAPALCGALVFMAGHALVEFTFSIYCYLPMAYGVFGAVTLSCGEHAARPALLEQRGVKNGMVIGMCVLMAAFMGLLGCNIAAQNLVEREASLENLEQAAALDPFEKADHMLSYVAQATGTEVSGEVREKADGYAARLERIESNIIPYYLAAYYLDTGRTEEGLEQAERYVRYVAAGKEAWEKTFALLEEYEQETREYRAGVCHIAELLDEWNEENMGQIELGEEARAFVERMRG